MDNLLPNSHQSSCLRQPAQKIKSAEFAKAGSSSKGSKHSSVINSSNEATGKANTKYSDEALLESSSLCSLGASNNINVCNRKRKHDDMDDSVQNEEEPEDVVKEKPAREGNGVKRSRNAELHNLCERKRRDKINKRMRMLKELMPNCNKTDKASMLDDAIEYLKTLKLQLQIMTMGGGFCMPFMMLPNLQQLMGVTDNRVHMFRFPHQVPTMPISHAPFIPVVGNPPTQTLLATATTTNMAENPSQLTTLLASLSKNSYLNGQAEHATNRILYS